MKRLRIALALLAVGIAIPVWLLVSRALEGLAFERAVRHEAVASRIFDEMESALSRLLEREEARAFEDYRFEDGATTLSSDPFVLAYFQIEPDGSFRAWAGPAAAADGEPVSEATLLDRYRDRVEGVFARPPATLARDIAPATTAAIATVAEGEAEDADLFGPVLLRQDAQKHGEAEADTPRYYESASTAYEVLENLNIAKERRASRKQKVVVRPRSELYAMADEAKRPPATQAAPAPAAGEEQAARASAAGEKRAVRKRAAGEEQAARVPAVREEQARSPEPEASLLRVARPSFSRSSDSPGGGIASRQEGDRAGADRRSEVGRVNAPEEATVRLAIDPMVGRRLARDDGTLVLYRTVLLGRQGYRQGLLLDLDRLGAWLDAQVLAERGLAGVAGAQFAHDPVSVAPPRDAGLRFRHDFGEPFDALSVDLDLAPLPGVASAAAIYGLSAMVVVVALAGLFAVYRMVSVVVRFAERRSNFVAAVSHELKTPLTSIRMYGEMLRDGLAPTQEKRDEYARTITDESERLTRLINNVLEFSQLEKGQRQVSLVAGPVEPVLAEVAEKLRPHARNAGFTLSSTVEEGLPSVRFDRDALLQVLFNLVDNAMKYAGDAERKEISLDARLEEGRVEVCVRDFGPGVPGAHLRHVFDPFYRGESELTRTTKGTGIGLALVRELAERMGATVRGDNVQGGGFRVSIAFEAAP